MISVIIPALNESQALPQTLRHLFSLDGDFEAILVDGGSLDNTVAIGRAWPRLKVISSDPGRAKQMNAGARIAAGDVLLFLHADTLLPANALAALDDLARTDSALWGGFHQQFSGLSPGLRFVSAVHNFRCGLTGVFYGDQAMFLRSSLFEEQGGFPDEQMLEDIMLSERLLDISPPTFMPESVITDSRKFEQVGVLKSLFRCVTILISYELGLPLRGRKFFAPIR